MISLVICTSELKPLKDSLDCSFVMDVLKGWLGTNMTATASTAFLLGVAFNSSIMNFEIDYGVGRLLGVYTTVLIGLLAAYATTGSFGMLETLARVLVVGFSFNIGLMLSIAAYRLCFHRLRNFLGPIGAKLSRFLCHSTGSKEYSVSF